MQLAADRLAPTSLAALGTEAARLLRSGDVGGLHERFGYALALGREPISAIRDDLARTFEEIGSNGFAQMAGGEPRVSYFKANETGLFGLVECLLATDNGKNVLLELVVTKSGAETHITLEQLSGAV
jgi:hypothetical protein